MNTNKVLILSLGTGRFQAQDDKRNEEKPEIVFEQFKTNNEKFPYRLAKYRINNNEPIESPFVGDALIKEYKPEKVVILGTIKSVWTALFAYYMIKPSNDDSVGWYTRYKIFEKLYNIQHNNGTCTVGNDLIALENEINDIFHQTDFISFPFDIKIILMQYGHKDDITINYTKMKKISDVLISCNSSVNDIAFDITHSFRTMPLYNLTILNYFKSLGNYNISISHIFYGNLDISNETGNIAMVDDLNELQLILNMTSGVNSFKNTGNVHELINIINELPESDASLISYLKDYEWNTQINYYSGIVTTLKNIINHVIDSNSLSGDAQNLIINTLKDNFSTKYLDDPDNIENKAYIQYELSCWYYNQHQYGLFLAIAIEAVKSLFLPLYCQKKKKGLSDNDTNRKAAFQEIGNQINNITNKSIIPNLTRLNDSLCNARHLRNIFAHCLDKSSSDMNKNAQINIDQINEFYNEMNNLFSKSHTKYYKLEYDRENTVIKNNADEKKYRIILPWGINEKNTNLEPLKKSLKCNYELITKPDVSCISKGKSINQARAEQDITDALNYVKTNYIISDNSTLDIVFYNISLTSLINYSYNLTLLAPANINNYYNFKINSNDNSVLEMEKIAIPAAANIN